MATIHSQPSEILIIGAGVLGLSTACALLQRPRYSETTITILDAAPQLPNPSGASVDTSRILRADYALKPYTRLVSEAQELWKDLSSSGWGGEGRYHKAKLILTSQPGVEGHVNGFLEESLENLKDLARSGEYAIKEDELRELQNRDSIKSELPFPSVSGDYGYVNENCGWVNAEACVRYAFSNLQKAGEDRVEIRRMSKIRKLLYERHNSSNTDSIHCCGVELEDSSRIHANLVILAAGAWAPSLVDLRGRAMATGQVLSYLTITEAEQEKLKSSPIYFNVSTGMFMVPPHHCELKIGRHGFGYQNPTEVSFSTKVLKNQAASTDDNITEHALVSTPETGLSIPAEAEAACKEFLLELFPDWSDRKFSRTRVCWYCDTPSGDFLIDYHPQYTGLFLATGDSGHAFKVFPVIGEKIVDAIEGKLDQELQKLWRWREDVPPAFNGTEDGTRGGKHGMLLSHELQVTGGSKQV